MTRFEPIIMCFAFPNDTFNTTITLLITITSYDSLSVRQGNVADNIILTTSSYARLLGIYNTKILCIFQHKIVIFTSNYLIKDRV